MRVTTRNLLSLLLLLTGLGWQATAQTVKDFVSVDAARYQPAVPPASIASGFTDIPVQLAVATDADPVTPGVQLPTTLSGVRVSVNNRPAGLLFVSRYQINYIVPDQTELDGPASVVVSDDQGNVLAQGVLNVATSSLNIFTANQYGTGSPAALFTADGLSYNNVSNGDGTANVVPAGQYLVLFGTGVRNGADVRCYIGGIEAPVLYAGAQPEFVALDQVNVQIPSTLANQGTVELFLTDGTTVSNTVTLNLGGNPTAPSTAPVITGLSVASATVGQIVTLTGSGFATNLAQASARLGSLACQIVSTSDTAMSFIIPFGAATSKVIAGNSFGERQSDAVLNITTSVSGTVLTTSDQPVSGMSVSVAGTGLATVTDGNGRFVLTGVPAGVVQLRIEATGYESFPSLAATAFSLVVTAGRDNQIGSPVYLFTDNGTGVVLNAAQGAARYLEAATPVVIENDGLKLEAPGTITFPDGKTAGNLRLKRLPYDGRLPAALPAGINPSVIALITPVGTTFGDKSGNGAATLTFPNPDQFPAGTQLDLYSFRPNVAPSKFVKKGTAVVSNDGKTIVASGLIDVATVWFVGVSGDNATQTTITGKVTDSKDQPVAGASVRVRGREAKTDKDGRFEIKGVYAKNGDDLTVGAGFVTPAGIRLLASVTVKAVVPGTTDAGTIKLPAEPPLVLLLQPNEVKLAAGQSAELKLVLSRPLGAAAAINLSVDGVALTLNPASLNVDAGKTEVKFTVSGATPGRARLRAVLAAAVDGLTPDQVKPGEAAVYVRYPVPVLDSITPTSGAPGASFTLTGSGLSGEAQNNRVFFKQGDIIVPVDPKTLAVVNTAAGGLAVESEAKVTLKGLVPGLKPGETEVFVQVVRDGITTEPSNKLKFTVTLPPGPTLVSIDPVEDVPGALFTLKGGGFDPEARNNGVAFSAGGKLYFVEPASLKVTISTDANTPSTLQGRVPRLPAGKAEVFAFVLRNGAPSASSNKLDFNVKLPPPVVLSTVAPAQGLPGATFTITGTGFDPDFRRNYIVFAKTGERPFVTLPTSLKIENGVGSLTGVVPRLTGGDAEIFVLTNIESVPAAQEGALPGTPSNRLAFKILSPDVPTAPTLVAMQPGEGAPGTSFVINGQGFDPTAARNLVFFEVNGGLFFADPHLLKLDGNHLSGLVPRLPAGDAKVFVVIGALSGVSGVETTNDGAPKLPGAASNKLPFKVLPMSAPQVTAINPTQGAPGTPFKITGTGFDTDAKHNLVFFSVAGSQGGEDKYFPVDPRTIKIEGNVLSGLVPRMPVGDAKVYVVIAYDALYLPLSFGVPGVASTPLDFKVLPPLAPLLNSVTPGEGTPGTIVTLAGSGFATLAEHNLVFFKQDNTVVQVPADKVKVVANGLQVVVPEMPAGAASIFVKIAGDNGVASDVSTVLPFVIKPKA